jgi:hypothetical protein
MPQQKTAVGLGTHENISLRLTNYDDIFSDFDPRPYSERALSVDFLEEAKRASIDKPSGGLELRLLLSAKVRKPNDENVIKKRMRDHFYKHAAIIGKRHANFIRSGIMFIVCGIIMMFFTALVLFNYSKGGLIAQFLLVLFEPAGWFLFWEGLDQVVFESKKILPELEFYTKMAESNIGFFSISKKD